MKKILIINSDSDTLNLLKSWLEKKEYNVKYTTNLTEVTGIINDYSPDLLLVDALEIDVLREIKSLVKSKKIPVILMTGHTINDEHKDVHFADDVIEKPFTPKLLGKKIDAFLKKTG